MRNEHDPLSAAWNIRAYVSAPEHGDSGCLQLGCKTFRRRDRNPLYRGEISDVAITEAMMTAERMWDVIPSCYDSQGNEVSLTVFLNSNQSKDCVGRAEEFEEQIRTGNIHSSPYLSELLASRKTVD